MSSLLAAALLAASARLPARPHWNASLHRPRDRSACPPALQASVNATGLLSVDYFRSPTVSCDQATRLAINASKNGCGGVIFFPTACEFLSTVSVPAGTNLQGGAVMYGNFEATQQTPITYAAGTPGPVFLVESVTNVGFKDLAILGWFSGVIVTNAAVVRFERCDINAEAQAGGIDDVDLTAAGCDGCNVVWGSNNTALVIENSYWVSAEDTAFFFYPTYLTNGSACPAYDKGQRPSVILRGNYQAHPPAPNTASMLAFNRIVTAGGQFQYQQLVDGGNWPGWMDFSWITSEQTASPLLDIQVGPNARAFEGLQQITINNYNSADIMQPHYLKKYPALTAASVECAGAVEMCPGLVPIVSLDCGSAPACHLSGLTMESISAFQGRGHQPPAVRVFHGGVDGVTVLGGQQTGAADVLDANNVPQGSWVSRSADGLTVVGRAADLTKTGSAALTAARKGTVGKEGASQGHALLVGEAGESGARLAIETNGALRWGDGKSMDFDTTLARVISNTSGYTMPSLAPGEVTSITIYVRGAEVADLATATFAPLGDSLVFVSARVSEPHIVFVLFKNEGDKPVKLPSGTLRAAVSKFT